MTKFCIGVVPNVGLDLVPIPFVIPNILAICTDGQQPFQRFDIVESLLQFDVQFFAFFFGPFARGYISGDALGTQKSTQSKLFG
jgi:hypothetical protein